MMSKTVPHGGLIEARALLHVLSLLYIMRCGRTSNGIYYVAWCVTFKDPSTRAIIITRSCHDVARRCVPTRLKLTCRQSCHYPSVHLDRDLQMNCHQHTHPAEQHMTPKLAGIARQIPL
ncbi:hypothetical protein L226DRAFT_131782 [Lentinus tigrinus ALCF2SS1-7]|uniref:uncharacterized protein n=1 Tax=Lentinus tigrinus ALCF2SS1-7 TaxID=1328758 RepID=UPI001165E10C|nr:hypothetical protein L226DRAFT_131782 [Lentinus tigrinus ALCF2SS1-7]